MAVIATVATAAITAGNLVMVLSPLLTRKLSHLNPTSEIRPNRGVDLSEHFHARKRIVYHTS
jgi:hypothetical protein